MNIREKLNRIFELSLELTPDIINYKEKKYPCVFVELIAHVPSVEVTFYSNGWEPRLDYDKKFEIEIIDDSTVTHLKTNQLIKADECIAYLESLLQKENKHAN